MKQISASEVLVGSGNPEPLNDTTTGPESYITKHIVLVHMAIYHVPVTQSNCHGTLFLAALAASAHTLANSPSL